MNEKHTENHTQVGADTQAAQTSRRVIPTELLPLVEAISALPVGIRIQLRSVLSGTIERASRRHRAQQWTQNELKRQVEYWKGELQAAQEKLDALQQEPKDKLKEN